MRPLVVAASSLGLAFVLVLGRSMTLVRVPDPGWRGFMQRRPLFGRRVGFPPGQWLVFGVGLAPVRTPPPRPAEGSSIWSGFPLHHPCWALLWLGKEGCSLPVFGPWLAGFCWAFGRFRTSGCVWLLPGPCPLGGLAEVSSGGA